jgi:hypothetical protein
MRAEDGKSVMGERAAGERRCGAGDLVIDLHVCDAAETREHLQLKKLGVFERNVSAVACRAGAASCRTLVGVDEGSCRRSKVARS